MDLIYIFILLALAILFLSNIFRGEKEDRDGKRPRPSDRPRSQEANVDRFLEEINRRRREAGDRRVGRAPSPVPAPPRRLEPVQPQTVRRPLSLPAETTRPRPAPEPRPYASPKPRIGKPAPQVPSATSPPVAVPLVVAEVEPPAPAPAPAVAKVSVPGPAVALDQFLPLLGSPQGLRSAILLQEILAPPLARRRRRRIV